MFEKLLLVIISLFQLFLLNQCQLSVEQSLVSSIFTGYVKTIRPSNVVSVSVSVALKQIVGIDEKNQIINE